MKNNRRKFLQNATMLAAGYLLVDPLNSVAGKTKTGFYTGANANTVSILHTANMHNRLAPFSFGKLGNIGGLYNAQLIMKDNRHALLVDAGGFLNSGGTLNDHLAMVRQMNKAGYAAVTVGAEELEKGEEHLATLIGQMNCAVVNCNYTFTNSVLKAKVEPYRVMHYGDYKIGITGIGPVHGVKHIDAANPYEKANETAAYLKSSQHCDLVVCLSPLGFAHDNNHHDNKKFAAASSNIDVIIGGHNDGVYHPQAIAKNAAKQQVVISNGGYGGSTLGALHFTFDDDKNLQSFNCNNYIPGREKGASFYEGFRQLTA